MADLSSTLTTVTSALQAQSVRLRLVSENIANVDTPGYRKKTTSFDQVLDPTGQAPILRQGRTELSQVELPPVFDPAHPLADETGSYLGSNVDLMTEIADAREAQRGYEANLKLFEQTRKMSSSLMDLLRR